MTLFIHTGRDVHISNLRRAIDGLVVIDSVVEHGDDVGVALDDLVEDLLDLVHGLLGLGDSGDDGDPVALGADLDAVVQDQHEHVVLALQLHAREDDLAAVLLHRFLASQDHDVALDLAFAYHYVLVQHLTGFH